VAPLMDALAQARNLMVSGLGDIWGKIRNRTAYEGLGRFLKLSYDALLAGEEPPVGYAQMDHTSRLIDALLAPENRI
jgi:hypothetical protein